MNPGRTLSGVSRLPLIPYSLTQMAAITTSTPTRTTITARSPLRLGLTHWQNEEWTWDPVDLAGHWPLPIVEFTKTTSGVELTWNTRPKHIYTVLACPNLTAGVSSEARSLASDGAATSWTAPTPFAQPRFYRTEL